MRDPSYYRDQAERARRLAMEPTDRETKETLRELARDYWKSPRILSAVPLKSGTPNCCRKANADRTGRC